MKGKYRIVSYAKTRYPAKWDFNCYDSEYTQVCNISFQMFGKIFSVTWKWPEFFVDDGTVN